MASEPPADGEAGDSELPRPTVAEVHAVLREFGALLGHFASYPPMDSLDDASPAYPDNLIRVLRRECPGGVCCSTFTAADQIVPGRNVSGDIGVILRPGSDRSVLAASPHDIGSRVVNGVRQFPQRPVFRTDLERSIIGRAEDGVNEWIVDDYEPLGIITLGGGWAYGAPVPQSPAMLAETFGVPIYRFDGGRLVRLDGDEWTPVEHSHLYP
ncbi:MAG: hypothetical protein DI537_10420 [Stutzerimonas stutzeri]|nr:MAG: hypothetical protein DI537_10420 [Stutzerimonas stutzeri]